MHKFTEGEWVIIQSQVRTERNGERHQITAQLPKNSDGAVFCPVTGERYPNVKSPCYLLDWDGCVDNLGRRLLVVGERSLLPIPKDNQAAGSFTTMMDKLLDTLPLIQLQ